jgi:hypothetical protein
VTPRTTLPASEVTAVLVTRGDVNMQPILDALPPEFEVVIWDNSTRPYDAGVYGRYVAIAEATRPVIFFQDDDCLLAPETFETLLAEYRPGWVVGNAIDDPVRLAKYHDTTLLGWGCAFDRELPAQAFAKYERYFPIDLDFKRGMGAEIVFPMLTPTVTVTCGIEWLDDGGPVLERPNRMWRQPNFYAELDFWLARARDVATANAAANRGENVPPGKWTGSV